MFSNSSALTERPKVALRKMFRYFLIIISTWQLKVLPKFEGFERSASLSNDMALSK